MSGLNKDTVVLDATDKAYDRGFVAGVEAARKQIEAGQQSVKRTELYPLNEYLRGMHTGMQESLNICDSLATSLVTEKGEGAGSNE